jgi:hypothetical protein
LMDVTARDQSTKSKHIVKELVDLLQETHYQFTVNYRQCVASNQPS